MTDLAYMIRSDWAQDGTAMVENGALIRAWLGEGKVVVAVPDPIKFADTRSIDREAADFIIPPTKERIVVSYRELHTRLTGEQILPLPLLAVQPFDVLDCERLRELVEEKRLARVAVLVWAAGHRSLTWLNSQGAENIFTGTPPDMPDVTMVEAAKMMVSELYNGIGHGRGKDVTVQLLRSFTDAGYPLDEQKWLGAFYRAGGDFGSAEDLTKFVREMKKGVRHRISPVLRPNIVEILRDRVPSE